MKISYAVVLTNSITSLLLNACLKPAQSLTRFEVETSETTSVRSYEQKSLKLVVDLSAECLLHIETCSNHALNHVSDNFEQSSRRLVGDLIQSLGISKTVK